jgi:soluble lytic murein transglycosylase-like protein
MRRYAICFVFALTAMVSLNVNAAERPTSKEAKGAWMTATPTEIDAAITHILDAEPAHHLRKDAAARTELATKLVAVAEAQGVPPMFALSIVFRESSFDEKAVGKLGELGLMQVSKFNVRSRACDMSNAEGQMTCGTRMLKEAYDLCGTWTGALTRYATKAGTCKSDAPNVQSKVKLRLRDWQRLSIAVQSALYEQGSEE